MADHLTAVPYLTCHGTELDFFIQYLIFRSRFILDIPLCSKKKEGCSVINQMFRLFKLTKSTFIHTLYKTSCRIIAIKH